MNGHHMEALTLNRVHPSCINDCFNFDSCAGKQIEYMPEPLPVNGHIGFCMSSYGQIDAPQMNGSVMDSINSDCVSQTDDIDVEDECCETNNDSYRSSI